MTSSPRSLVLIVLGALAIVVSLAWSWCNPHIQDWTPEKASELQSAQSTLHRLGGHGEELSRPAGRSARDADAVKKTAEYRAALATHERLRAELTAAQNRNGVIERMLLWGGAALVVAGWLTTRGERRA